MSSVMQTSNISSSLPWFRVARFHLLSACVGRSFVSLFLCVHFYEGFMAEKIHLMICMYICLFSSFSSVLSSPLFPHSSSITWPAISRSTEGEFSSKGGGKGINMVGKQEKAEQQRGHFNLLGQYSSLKGCTFILLTDSQQEVQEG